LKEVHRLRSRSDAVLVGIGTVLADDPALTVREVKGRDPLRVIVDTDARTPATAKVVRAKDPQRTVIFVARDADVRRVKRLRDAGVLVTSLPRATEGLELAAVLRWLADQGVNTVLSEAGPGISSTLVSSGLADRLMLLTAPIAGGDGPSAFNGLDRVIDLKSLKARKLGDDVVMEADL
jgi:riboflavin-specific deaminase-like protein